MKPQKISKHAILLRDTYEIYAKMLAIENIRVVYDESISSPAQFDLVGRVLYISPTHHGDEHLVPGLVVHEVGHAVFSILTPEEAKHLKKISRLLNIIDDGYQERQMCKKYPNCKKHLRTVFDYFFTKEVSVDTYQNKNKLISIVNTLNHNCKGFKHGHYKKYGDYVLPEDLLLLQEAEMININSLVGRDVFAKKLAKALEKYGEMKNEDTDLDKNSNSSKTTGSSDISEDDGDQDDTDSDSDEKQHGDGDGGDNSEKPDEIDDELEKNKHLLNDHHEKLPQTLNGKKSFELPSGQELFNISEVSDLYKKDSPITAALTEIPNQDMVDDFNTCLKEAKKIANRIFTKFNMRVQASNYANSQFTKSGMLDPERAALYQVCDDVFMKTAIDQNQPNHAYTVMLDWSGSMDSSVYPLMLRIMELAYFAKSADIEIEVWLYTSSDSISELSTIKNNIAVSSSKFIKILNTKKHNATELDMRIKHFWFLASHIGSYTSTCKGAGVLSHFLNFQTSGTTILEGLMFGHHVLSTMVAEKKTCFMLTDGQDTTCFDVLYDAASKKRTNTIGKVYLNGFDVSSLHPSNNVRTSATSAVSEMYASVNQKTVGVAWNTNPSSLKAYCDAVIVSNTPRKNTKTDGPYVNADNIFIDEIVKNLL
jgi:hypothetical protein